MILLATYLRMIQRKFKLKKLHILLNLLTLSLGFAVAIIVFLVIRHELSFDKMHSKAERISRVTMHIHEGNYNTHWARVNVDWINNLPAEFSEIKHLIRFQNYYPRNIKVGDQTFKVEHAFSTDQEVFNVFDFKLRQGNPETALAQPNTVVLTEKLARQFFNDKDPMGQFIEVIDQSGQHKEQYLVTGIMKDLPENTHLPVQMLTSFARPDARKGWAYCYLLFRNQELKTLPNVKMNEFIEKYAGKEAVGTISFPLQSLKEIHLGSRLAREIVPNGSRQQLFILAGAGLFLLIMSLINFINLNIAQSLQKLREIGVRKVIGSTRSKISLYFLTEAAAFSILAVFAAIFLTFLYQPLLQQFFNVNMSDWAIAWFSVFLVIMSTLIIGWYPIMILSASPAIAALKNKDTLHKNHYKGNIRSILVGIQLSLGVLLISCSLILKDQFKFLTSKNLGFETEQVMALTHLPEPVKTNLNTFKNILSQHSTITQLAGVMEVPSEEIRDSGPVYVEGASEPENRPLMDIQVADHGFIPMMKIKLLAGRNFKKKEQWIDLQMYKEDPFSYLQSQPREYIINHSAMQQAGWKSPEEAIGQTINWSIGNIELQKGPVVGVVEDFHQESLRNAIEPLVIINEPVWANNLLLAVNTNQLAATVKHVKKVWQENFPDYEMNYAFLDDLFQQLYLTEARQMKMIGHFTIIALLIAFLGNFSLLSFIFKTREKEMAIRKLLGASTPSMALATSKNILIQTFWILLISLPVGWWLLQKWLSHYAYRIELNPAYFLWALLLILITFILNLFLKLSKINKNNPAQVLRNSE